jgi:hypothetical protein
MSLLNPLTAWTGASAGLLILFFLWCGARIDARRCRREITSMKQCTDSALQELASKINEIEVRPAPEPPLEHFPINQSLNLTRRARALHMRHRGDEPHTIAAALGISHGEVELLFKLDGIFQRRDQTPAAEG